MTGVVLFPLPLDGAVTCIPHCEASGLLNSFPQHAKYPKIPTDTASGPQLHKHAECVFGDTPPRATPLPHTPPSATLTQPTGSLVLCGASFDADRESVPFQQSAPSNVVHYSKPAQQTTTAANVCAAAPWQCLLPQHMHRAHASTQHNCYAPLHNVSREARMLQAGTATGSALEVRLGAKVKLKHPTQQCQRHLPTNSSTQTMPGATQTDA
jgi:hypothetical protein